MRLNVTRADFGKAMACVVAMLIPPGLVVVLSTGPFASQILPDVIFAEPMQDQAATMLGEVAKIMITLSIGAGVASTFFYRMPLLQRARPVGTSAMACAAILAFISIFAGLRFLHDLGQQMIASPIQYALVQDRLHWQGWALIGQVSLLSLAGVLNHLYRDRRYGMKVDR